MRVSSVPKNNVGQLDSETSTLIMRTAYSTILKDIMGSDNLSLLD